MTEQRELHPQYQILRALADGWKVQRRFKSIGAWATAPWVDEGQYRIVPDSEGWIPYYAEEGKCPVDGDALVALRCGKIEGDTRLASTFDWGKCGIATITHYRIIEQAKNPEPAKVDPDALQWAKRTLGQPQQYSDQRKAAREILRLAGEGVE